MLTEPHVELPVLWFLLAIAAAAALACWVNVRLRTYIVYAGVASLVLSGSFVFVQTVRHRDYVLDVLADDDPEPEPVKPPGRVTAASAVLLPISLTAVVLLGKAGGREMMAGSDLDLMLVYNHPAHVHESTGPRRLRGM